MIGTCATEIQKTTPENLEYKISTHLYRSPPETIKKCPLNFHFERIRSYVYY